MTTPTKAELEQLEKLRADGWAVAVHNDYRLHGVPHTFWLLTKGDRFIKGEGLNDDEALAQCTLAAEMVEWKDETKPSQIIRFNTLRVVSARLERDKIVAVLECRFQADELEDRIHSMFAEIIRDEITANVASQKKDGAKTFADLVDDELEGKLRKRISAVLKHHKILSCVVEADMVSTVKPLCMEEGRS